jgi:hypothetical protein
MQSPGTGSKQVYLMISPESVVRHLFCSYVSESDGLPEQFAPRSWTVTAAVQDLTTNSTSTQTESECAICIFSLRPFGGKKWEVFR